MEIRCKSSGRFLGSIDIEQYHEKLKKMGIDISTPITLLFACPKCKMIEEYEIYPTHYIHTKSYLKDRQENKKVL